MTATGPSPSTFDVPTLRAPWTSGRRSRGLLTHWYLGSQDTALTSRSMRPAIAAQCARQDGWRGYAVVRRVPLLCRSLASQSIVCALRRSTPELMSAAEIADELGFRVRGHQLRSTAGFPACWQICGRRVWDAAAVRRFAETWERKPGRLGTGPRRRTVGGGPAVGRSGGGT